MMPNAIRSGSASIFAMAVRTIRPGAASLQTLRGGGTASNISAMMPNAIPSGAPGQQQTLFGGEKYSGLASNLAHLGRIC